LTRPTHAPDARRLTRVPLLIGSMIVALGAGGAAVATAQTTTSSTEETATAAETAPTADDTATETPTGDETPTEDELTDQAGSTTNGSAGTDGSAAEEQAAQGTMSLRVERVDRRRLFTRSGKTASFTYEIGGGGGGMDVRIQVVKKGSGEVVKGWLEEGVQSGERNRVHWGGSSKDGGKVGPGTYRFRVHGVGGSKIERDEADGNRRLGVYPAKFPVRGPHQYWDGWGAGRGHQGQDVGAKCGTSMVAVQAGRVAFKGYDGGGYGNYIAINVSGERHAHIYAHMRGKPDVRRGERVKTGEHIGNVGQSGNAVGCHLHFEYWRGKWGRGGRAVSSVTRHLRKWDRWS
jgi:murein DD-endopeptidase MepM/ murein hydrolase activator NlpD